jgi:hypothetical protein
MTQRRLVRKKVKKNSKTSYLVAGGSMLALVGFLANPFAVFQPPVKDDVCQGAVQPQAVLSRDRLSQLLAVPERSPKATVRAIVQDPYCTLPEIEVRAGVVAQREVYPLAFDPETWFIVLYEGEEYAGYSFSFQH